MTATAVGVLIAALTALITALIALSKRRPEMAQVLVTSAGAVVIMQRDLLAASEAKIDELEAVQGAQATALKDLQDQMNRLENERNTYREQLHRVTRERDMLETANVEMLGVNADLESRVGHLEAEVRRLGGTLPEAPPEV